MSRLKQAVEASFRKDAVTLIFFPPQVPTGFIPKGRMQACVK